MKDEEIKQFFRKLVEECRKDKTYSVIETAKEMGVDYEQVQRWAKSDEGIAEVLDFCRMCCANNAEMDALKFKLSEEDFLKYMCENNDEFKKRFEKQKKEKWLAEKERRGEEIIERTSIVIEDKNKDTVQKKDPIAPDSKKNLIAKQWQKNRKVAEEERIRKWEEKKAKCSPGLTYKVTKTKNNTSFVGINFCKKNLTQNQKANLYQSTMCAATGSASEDFALKVLSQTVSSFFKIEGVSTTSSNCNAILEALLALKPRDEIEGMLISRMLAVHDQYMHFMARVCSPTQTTAGVDMNINRATKLMRLYNETLEALNRYRRKGQQKITVQHVNVSDGGQAIIGNLKTGGGDNAKK